MDNSEGENDAAKRRDELIVEKPNQSCKSCEEVLKHLKLVLENMREMREMQEV